MVIASTLCGGMQGKTLCVQVDAERGNDQKRSLLS